MAAIQNNSAIEQSQNIPTLRFPEFGGEWKNTVLKKTAKINPKNENLPDSFIYIDLESVNDGLLVKEQRTTRNAAPSRAQRLLRHNDILYQTVRPYQKNNLFFDKKDDSYVASTGYAQIRTNNSARFIFQYLHTDFFVNKVLVRCTGTSYPAINSSDLSKIKIHIPTLPEQQKIANFLTSVDTKIEQLTKKKSLLKQYKKGIMQQIFSQKLRFKPAQSEVKGDENGNAYPDWEVKKLGEIGNITIGEFVIKTKQNPNGRYPVFNGGRACTGYYDNYNNEGNKIIISARGANAGFVNYEKGKFWAGNSCYSVDIIDKDINNVHFIFHYMKYKQNLFTDYQQAANIPSVSKKDAQIFKIICPKTEEQQNIADFLTAIDRKIEFVNTQLENTQQFKKGLLQQLFV